MANPQLEDGHTRVANEILEHLAMSYMTPNQWQVIIFIIRKTYGFKKKVDYLANFQIVNGTKLSKSVVSRVLKALESRNIITRHKKEIGLQKDWEKWKLAEQSTLDTKLAGQSTNKSLLNSQPGLTKQSTKVDSPVVTQKKKETIQKKYYYGEFNNVLLTDEEYQRLQDKFGLEAHELIERLSAYLASRGKKYKSHYATILNWQRRNKESGKTRNPRELPKGYTDSPDYPD